MAKKTIRTIPQERANMPVQEPSVRATNFDEVALPLPSRTLQLFSARGAWRRPWNGNGARCMLCSKLRPA